ncbi:hypothetical protein [uncultured Brevundimonas sp.]|uniref:hypothetical protein n=1 Tax=uncultured Brevundimonas sp. TaxID=213418 RepID=UPI0025CE702B|nr:hypothetical protein [uncultured Brevundimonas sp.]
MLEVISFTPAQAAKISGVNATLQRDWRRRKILPPLEAAQASYSPLEVAKMMALGALAAQGLSPLNYRGVAEKMGAAIIHSALLNREAYTGALDAYLPRDISQLIGSEKIRRSYGWDFSRSAFEEQLEGIRLYELATTYTKQNGHNVRGVGAFVQFAEGSFDFYAGPIEPFEVIDDTDPRRQGAIVVVDLSALGREFQKRAGAFAHMSATYIAAQPEYSWAKRVTAEIASLRLLAKGSEDGGDEQASSLRQADA